ncbi:MAG: acyl-CoA carboxylase subunit beta [Anaerolineaceae bacterium]|nr:acyl-CoA carboxylase subunit beta [Anaerolineaceae bacterium]
MSEDPRIIELREKKAQTQMGGGGARIEKQHAKGKYTARERIAVLLDENSFHELDPFITQRNISTENGTESNYGDGVITGYGSIDGRTVYVYAQDFTVMGGALGEMHGKKICNVMDKAAENGKPIIGIIDSGGARIQEGVHSLGGYAEVFKRNAQYSGTIPQISIIMGPCAGGAAYSPAVTDCIIMVEGSSYMFLTGPSVIKAVTGEEIDFENLGGAKVHHSQSGLAHLTSPDEQSALATARLYLSYLPDNYLENAPIEITEERPDRMEESLNQLIPLSGLEPYSMHVAISYIVDQNSFLEIQSTFAPNAIIGFARIGGYAVGIVSQEPCVMAGVVDIDAADKISRFVRLCDCFNIPLVTFIDSPGFLPGIDQEHRGIIRHGAKVLYAYAEATVPKISIVTRKAYGGAYVVLSSKYLGTDICYAWPSAEIAVMGAEGAVNILYGKQINSADDPVAEREKLTELYRSEFLNPYTAAKAGYIDDIIEPRETRPAIYAAITALRDKAIRPMPRKHGNIPL